MLIRRASEMDVDAITVIVHEAYAPYIPRIGKEPAPMLDDYREVIERCRVVVLEAEGVLKGGA